MPRLPIVPVVTAVAARACDERTIAALGDSFALMHRAASTAATWLDEQAWRSAAVYVGGGNNGGDGWLIAGLLREFGWQVRVHVAVPPRTPDAQRARFEAERAGTFPTPQGDEHVVLDALLGTGATGAPRDSIRSALETIRHLHVDGAASHAPVRGIRAVIVAVDMPTGLDATSGADHGALAAEFTLSFGSVKRGQLLRRDLVGSLHVLDIGIVEPDADEPRLVDGDAVQEWLNDMPADAYKSTRGRLAIVGGGDGMAGAVILAARGAHAAGVGMVRCDVATESALALQVAVPFATVAAWRSGDWRDIDTRWPHALVIGPGLDGAAPALREQVLALLHASAAPVVLDAGALTAFRSHAADDDDVAVAHPDVLHARLDALRHALRGRPALLTPHVGEFATLFSPRPRADGERSVHDAALARFDDPLALARALNATILLKGVPTVIASPDGVRLVCATGNPALAVGGTGDMLAGIAGALLAQGMPALHAGAIAAWVHGTAAEHATNMHGGWRGVTMDLLLHAVTNVWPSLGAHPLPSHTLLELPRIPLR